MVGYERIVQYPNRLIVEQMSKVKVVAGKLFDSQGESISVEGVLLSSIRSNPSSPAQRVSKAVASVEGRLKRMTNAASLPPPSST